MRLTWTSRRLRLRTPLRISRSTMAERDAVQVTLTDDNGLGNGEIVTSRLYGLDLDGIDNVLRRVTARLAVASAEDVPTLVRDLPAGVAAGLDAAAHDLLGRRAGVPVHALLPVPPWQPCPTAFTIGLDPPEQVRRAAASRAAEGFSVLKVKLGAGTLEDDVAAVQAARAGAPQARLLLDPNGGWGRDEAVRRLDVLNGYGVEAVEQPVAPGHLEDLAWVTARSPIPVIADEDARSAADVPGLVGAADGVNVKLTECGGIRAALTMVQTARAAGLEVMLGCQVASSLGLAPAVQLTSLARWVDLDGHLLLADDPWTGLGGEGGVLSLSGDPGLGVRPSEPDS